jgi:antitoxin YefM
MSVEISYTQARDNLASLMDRVIEEREIIRIHRKTQGETQDVAIIAADELDGLLETAHLLRSPKNAERLFSALTRALSQTGTPGSIEDLERDLGLNSEDSSAEDNSAKATFKALYGAAVRKDLDLT